MAEATGRTGTWVPALAVAGCLAAELALAAAPVGWVAQSAALALLAATAVALSLRQALGGLSARALRLAVVGPVVFSIVLVVVLALDAHVRAGALLR